MDRQALAQAAGDAIWREDRASRYLGMKLDELKPGYARMTMTVTEQMANAQALCHGELIAVFRGKSATVKGKWVE